MPDPAPKPEKKRTSSASARRLRVTATIVLVVGLIAGAGLYLTGQPEKSPGILGFDIRTNRDRAQLERMGGKGYVALKDFDDWFATLWRGRRLGCTVAALSVVGFLFCRALAYAEAEFKSEAELAALKAPAAPPAPAAPVADDGPGSAG